MADAHPQVYTPILLYPYLVPVQYINVRTTAAVLHSSICAVYVCGTWGGITVAPQGHEPM